MGALTLSKVTKSFGKTDVIKGVDLHVEEGEFCVFVGPSGCGKSTLLRMIAGLEDVTTGSVTLDGRDITHEAPAKREIAMVFQTYALYPHLTVRDNMSLALKQAGESKAKIDQSTARAAAMLALEPYLDRRPAELSGGQRQRVAIARALLADAPVLLLDEATSALDTRTEAAVSAALSCAQSGRTTLVIAHRLSTVKGADKIIVLDHGRLVEEGTHDSLMARGGLYAQLQEAQLRD